MSALPLRSPGVLLSGAHTAVAQDLVTETLHRLNASALALLDACDGRTELDEIVATWAELTGATPDGVRSDVSAALATFRELGLVDRIDPPPLAREMGEPAGAESFEVRGTVHPVVGHAVQFVGTDPELVALVDDHLGPGDPSATPTRRFTIEEDEQGSIRLVADSAWVFPSRLSMLDQVTTLVNEYGHESPEVVTLHSAGLVRPDGVVTVFPAVSGAGKSTLAGHLVARGWGYLGDESIGIRRGDLAALPYPKPLALDDTSRAALGLAPSERWNTSPAELASDPDVRATSPGPIRLVVLPTFARGAELEVERLDPRSALEALISNTLNLAATGQDGMDTLDDLATSVPVYRVRHCGDAALDDWLAEVET